MRFVQRRSERFCVLLSREAKSFELRTKAPYFVLPSQNFELRTKALYLVQPRSEIF
jgi:hypothetical protein